MTTTVRELLDRVLSAVERRIDAGSGDIVTADEELTKRADAAIASLEGSSATAPAATGADSPPTATDTAAASPPVPSTTGEPVSGGVLPASAPDVPSDPKQAELDALKAAVGEPTTTTTTPVAPPPGTTPS